MANLQRNVIKSHLSPGHDARRHGAGVDMLVLHYTGMASGTAALARLCDPAAKVSAHYLIEEDGRIFALVPEDRRAWHAGVSYWAGESDINSCSIGIELVNPGHEFGYRPFPETQMAALQELAGDIVSRYGICPSRVLGHSDVAPARKTDPGELFDWRRLAAAGIGFWPVIPETLPDLSKLKEGDVGPAVAGFKQKLQGFGYGMSAGERFDTDTRLVVSAFQRHFRQARVDGIADAETRTLANRLPRSDA